MANKDLLTNNANFINGKMLYIIYIIFREFVYNIYLLLTRVELPPLRFLLFWGDQLTAS